MRVVLLRLAWVLFAVAVGLAPASAAASSSHVEQADLNGDINNVMSSYIQTAVSRAEADHADALLVVMNTPGGISTSMDEIVTSLLNSTVPVIVYVYPSGARAASAGLFVAQAADGKDTSKLTAHQRAIKVGSIVGDDYPVLEGIKPGEKVVISGSQKLVDGAPVVPAPDAAGSAPQPPAPSP